MLRYRYKKLYMRFFALLLALTLIIGNSFSNYGIISEAQEVEELSDYSPELTLGDKTLYIDTFTGNFAVYNTKLGKVWYSTPQGLEDVDMKNSKKNLARSALFLTVLDNNANEGTITISSQSGSVRDREPEITIKGNTAKIVYVFEEYGFTVPLEITLTNYGFSASVDTKQIKEENKQYSLIGVSLLPYFNAGYYEENGFMLVPDGSGAVIEFNNGRGEYSEYSGEVYGGDSSISLLYDSEVESKVCMPFFGIAKNGYYSMGFISSGASIATVKAVGNLSNNLYNYCYSYFLLRSMDYYRNEGKWQDVEVYQKGALPKLSLKVDYVLGENSVPDYSVMSAKLREYITEEYSFSKKPVSPSLQIDIVGATVKKRMFLGIPVYGVQKLTDFNETEQMIERLYENGIGEINLVYSKWSKATAKLKMSPSDSLSLLGGKKDFMSLKNMLSEKNGKLYLSVEPFYVKSGKIILSSFTDFAHGIFNSTVELYPYKLNTYSQNTDEKAKYPVKNSSLARQISSWDKELSGLKIDGILFASTDMPHSDFREDGTSRFDFESRVGKALSETKNTVITEGGSFYAAVSSEYISSLPMSSKRADIEDYSVPFVQMVLHGLVGYSGEAINAQANFRDAFLRTVETGSAMRFVFTAADSSDLENSDDSDLIYSSFDHWEKDLTEMYSKYNKFYEAVRKETVVSHTRLQENIYMTEYSNGFYSIVNYGETSVLSENGNIEAKGFIFGEK